MQTAGQRHCLPVALQDDLQRMHTLLPGVHSQLWQAAAHAGAGAQLAMLSSDE